MKLSLFFIFIITLFLIYLIWKEQTEPFPFIALLALKKNNFSKSLLVALFVKTCSLLFLKRVTESGSLPRCLKKEKQWAICSQKREKEWIAHFLEKTRDLLKTKGAKAHPWFIWLPISAKVSNLFNLLCYICIQISLSQLLNLQCILPLAGLMNEIPAIGSFKRGRIVF